MPLHFTAFHPDYKMRDVPRTPPETLRRARGIALRHGLRYVYTGNVHDAEGGRTSCPRCGAVVIERDWYVIGGYRLTDDGPLRRLRHRAARPVRRDPSGGGAADGFRCRSPGSGGSGR